MGKYKIAFYVNYVVEAGNKQDALDTADEELAEFLAEPCSMTDLFNYEVEEIDDETYRLCIGGPEKLNK